MTQQQERYLVGVHGERTGQVLGPYGEDEVRNYVRGQRMLKEDGADTVLEVRATSHYEARRKARESL